MTSSNSFTVLGLCLELRLDVQIIFVEREMFVYVPRGFVNHLVRRATVELKRGEEFRRGLHDFF